jgi:hypothetical protein
LEKVRRQAAGCGRYICAGDLWFTDHRAASKELTELVLYRHEEYVIKAGLKHWHADAIARFRPGCRRRKPMSYAASPSHVECSRNLTTALRSRHPCNLAIATTGGPGASDTESIKKACTAYLDELKQRQAAGQISASHVRSQEDRLIFSFKNFDFRETPAGEEHEVPHFDLEQLKSLSMNADDRRSGIVPRRADALSVSKQFRIHFP